MDRKVLDDNFHPWKVLPTWLLAHFRETSIFHYKLQLGDRCCTIVKTFPTSIKN